MCWLRDVTTQEMYETALEACLNEQDGTGQSWEQSGVAELLLHLKSELRLSDCMDCLARAHVLLLRTGRLSELERRIRGGCRAARREQEVLTEVQRIRALLNASGCGASAGDGVISWGAKEEKSFYEKVMRDVCGFCRDAIEDYHDYIETGANQVWESMARLLATCEQPQNAAYTEDGSDGGHGGDGGMAPPPVISGASDFDDTTEQQQQQQEEDDGRGFLDPDDSDDQSAVAAVATQCIAAGVRRLYLESEHIAAADFDSDPSFGELGAIADAVAAQLADEAKHSAPFFAEVHPSALRSIAEVLAESIRAHYRKCCIAEEDSARRYARIVSAADGDAEGGGNADGELDAGSDASPRLPAGGSTSDAELPSLLTLSPDVVRCIHCLHALDEQLVACGLPAEETLLGFKGSNGGSGGSSTPAQYNGGSAAMVLEENRFPGLVEAWLDEKRLQFDNFVGRCIELEEECHWAPVLESEAAVVYESSSVLDLFKLFSQAVDSFLDMELPPWETSFLSLLEHIVGAAIAYANRLHESCLWLVQQAAPPARPRLKRPSRDERIEGSRGSSVASLAAGALRLATAGGIALPKGSGADGGSEADAAEANLQSVVTRLNNVDYGARQFKSLWSRLAQKWSAVASRGGIAAVPPGRAAGAEEPQEESRSAFVGMSPHGSRRLDAMLGGMENSYRTTADELASAVARMVTYGEHSAVRAAMLDSLYMQGDVLADCRVDDQLCALIEETLLGEAVLSTSLSPTLLPQLARELRSSVLGCYDRILLDGGAGRVFAASDSTLLKEDYLSLLATFAQLQAESEEIASKEMAEISGGSDGSASGLQGRTSGDGRRDEQLRKAVGRGGLDACVCSRRVECQHALSTSGSQGGGAAAPAATVFCADCGCTLYCAACSAALHVGGYACHTPWSFGETREQARSHALMELLATSSAALVVRLREMYAAGPTGSGSGSGHAQQQQLGAVDGSDLARILAHRDDEDALKYMRETVLNFDSAAGGAWDPTGGAAAAAAAGPSANASPSGGGGGVTAPLTPPGGNWRGSSPAGAAGTAGETAGQQQQQTGGGGGGGGMLGRRGSAGSAMTWSPGSVGSLFERVQGDVSRAMRR